MKKYILSFFLVIAGLSVQAAEIYDSGGGGGGGGGSGSGTVSAGTAGQIPQYTAGTTIGPSNFTQNSDGSFGIGGSTFAAISSTFNQIAVYVSSPSVTSPVATFSTRTALGYFYTLTVDSATTVSASLTNASATEMIVPLAANSTYYFHANIIFQTAATTTGLALAYDCPVDSTTTAQVRIHNAADGTAGEFQGTIHGPGEQVTATGVEALSTNQGATIDGWISTITAGNWTLQYTTEINGSTAKLKAGSHVIFTKITN